MKLHARHDPDESHFFVDDIEVPYETYKKIFEQEASKKHNATNSSMVVDPGVMQIKSPAGAFRIYPTAIIMVSGGFDPIHIGHIRMFQAARDLYPGSFLYVILNSDQFLIEKKGFVFMPFNEREEILQDIKSVDFILPCVDEDQTVRESIRLISKMWVGADKIVFANGGDRTQGTVPEEDVCRELGIEMAWNVGGGKIQSSSDLVRKLHENKKDSA
jgi:D-beta-D-heptose 7-phosphate kinase/D-beta-D-heptose 1-phosphate adenosyltransferase